MNRKLYGAGDMVWAYRKPYHGTDEKFCTDKLVRPFLILSEIDNEFLVLPMTSKMKPSCVKYNDSYIVTDDYYVIERKDIVNYMGYCSAFKNLLKEAYDNLESSFNVTPRNIKNWLLDVFNNYYIINHEYNIADIIKTFKEHQYYIVDSVKKDGVYAFKIFKDGKIDFSSNEYLSNNEIYKVEDSLDLKTYLEKRNESYEEFNKKITIQKKNDKRKKKNSFSIDTGSIIKIEEEPVFVIDTNKNYLVCIPCNDDYRLTGIIKVKKDNAKIKFVKNLSSVEILPILKELSKNIHVMQDTVIQNHIFRYTLDHESKSL